MKLAFIAGDQPSDNIRVTTGMAYDAKGWLFWVDDSSWNGGVWAMRFDASKAEIAPLKDFVAPPAERK